MKKIKKRVPATTSRQQNEADIHKDRRLPVLILFGLLILAYDVLPPLFERSKNILPPEQIQQYSNKKSIPPAAAGEGAPKGLSPRTAFFRNLPMDINRATVDDLTLLPGIGQRLAERIVVFRDAGNVFRSGEDLQRVPGIGKKMSRKISLYVTFSQP